MPNLNINHIQLLDLLKFIIAAQTEMLIRIEHIELNNTEPVEFGDFGVNVEMLEDIYQMIEKLISKYKSEEMATDSAKNVLFASNLKFGDTHGDA